VVAKPKPAAKPKPKPGAPPSSPSELAAFRKAKAWELLITGKSLAAIRSEIGEGADAAVQAVMKEIVVPSASEATKMNVERLSHLAASLMPKAEKGDEVAINAVVKIFRTQLDMIIALAESEGENGKRSTLSEFRRNSPKRRKAEESP
jgi:hypothetical protein